MYNKGYFKEVHFYLIFAWMIITWELCPAGFFPVRLDTVRPVEVDGEKYYNLC
jgi:hypothetical protein